MQNDILPILKGFKRHDIMQFGHLSYPTSSKSAGGWMLDRKLKENDQFYDFQSVRGILIGFGP